METRYYKEWSPALGRDAEMKSYGHGGRPVLFIPCQDGRFFDFENFRLAETMAPWIESGQIIVYAIDTIDSESWSAQGDPYWRIRRYEDWIRYITDELVPFIRDDVNARNGWDGYPGIMTFGCSLGATHAANLFFRRPDLFDGMLALSGIYTASYGFGDYMDEVVYRNSIVDYLGGMPSDHPFIQQYNSHRGIICVGQGPWEMPETTRQVANICRDKGIQVWVDFWGYDCAHDWDWWYKQVRYFMPILLQD